MGDAPPALIMTVPPPATFRLEQLGEPDSPAILFSTAESCPLGADGEIVVCGRRLQSDRLGEPLPPVPTLMDEVTDKLHFNIGPIMIGSRRGADGQTSFGIGIRF